MTASTQILEKRRELEEVEKARKAEKEVSRLLASPLVFSLKVVVAGCPADDRGQSRSLCVVELPVVASAVIVGLLYVAVMARG